MTVFLAHLLLKRQVFLFWTFLFPDFSQINLKAQLRDDK